MLSDEQFSQEVKSKSYVVKQMTDILNNPNFKNLRENLKNDRKKKMIITLSIGGVLGLILGFIVGFTSESALIGVVVGVFVFLCSLIGLATIAKSAKNKYAASIAPEVINALYGPNAEYAPNGGYSKEYDDYIQKYTVEKPQNIDDDDSVDETMYEKVFGKNEV